MAKRTPPATCSLPLSCVGDELDAVALLKAAGVPCSRSTVYRWAKDGARLPDGSVVKLPSVRIGGRRYTSRDHVEGFASRVWTS